MSLSCTQDPLDPTLFSCSPPSGVASFAGAGDNAWLLISTALVQLMTPGIALFYSGMVGEGSALSTMMLCFGSMGVVSVLWALVGFSLSFAPSQANGVIGDLSLATLDLMNSGTPSPGGGQVTALTFCMFQLMFAIITSSIIAGSVAGKMKFSWFMVFTACWHLFVYCPLTHWIFYSKGWLFTYGVLDFAGGMVIHTSSGVSSFVLAFWLGWGKRQQAVVHRPHNVPHVLIGASFLWFGWVGFNAGSAMSSGYVAGLALANTQLAAAIAMLTWNIMEVAANGAAPFKGLPTAVGAATGAIVGLVGVTPGAGLVSPMWALFIGCFTSAGVFFLPRLIKRLTGVDDTLDCFAIHGIGGMIGSALTGLFANGSFSGGVNGSFYGSSIALGKQCAAISVVVLYCSIATSLIYWVLWACASALKDTLDIPLAEHADADTSQHGERAYYSKTTAVAPTAAEGSAVAAA